MLLYSTILDIQDTMTKDAFIQLVIEWNQGSPHQENVIQGIQWNGEKSIRFGDDNLWLEIIEYRNKNIIAVRYEKITDDGVIWDTDYIMNFDEMRMAIRLDRSYQEQAIVTNAEFSTPHFVSLLMQKGYLKPDGILEFSRNALYLTEDNITVLADIVAGTVKYQLPVVYVSKTVYNKDPLSVDWLCSKLKGAAHIIVQKDKQSNNQIREECDGKNEYNGAIGIYYPSEALGHKRCIAKKNNEKNLMDRVVSFVLEFSIVQKIDKLYTWQGVSNSLLNDRFVAQRTERLAAEQARDKAKSEVDDVYETLDAELQNLQRNVEELTRTNEIQTYEIQSLRAKLAQTEEVPVLVQGEEEEMYPGEIKDYVLAVLADAAVMADDGTRKKHVLNDIVEQNNYQHLAEIKRQEIKKIFRGYKNINRSMKQQLIDFGFEVIDEGKHYKLIYKDDSRYMTTVAKTPSDHRTGDNVAGTICREML